MLNGYITWFILRECKNDPFIKGIEIKISDIAPDYKLCQEKENKNVV